MIACIKCKGLGIYRRSKECDDCKGTGQAVLMRDGLVTFQGLYHSLGDVIPFTSNSGMPVNGVVEEYYVSEQFMKVVHVYPADVYPLRVVWFWARNIKTNKLSPRPLWKSINLKKRIELFESNKVMGV